MKWIKLVSFLIGVILALLGHFVSNSDDYPFVKRLLSPSYCKADAGYSRLLETRALLEGAEGFDQIEAIAQAQVRGAVDPSRIIGPTWDSKTCTVLIHATSFRLTASTAMGNVNPLMADAALQYEIQAWLLRRQPEGVVTLPIKFPTPAIGRMPIEELRAKIDALKQTSSKIWKELLLFGGLVLMTAPFWPEKRKPRELPR